MGLPFLLIVLSSKVKLSYWICIEKTRYNDKEKIMRHPLWLGIWISLISCFVYQTASAQVANYGFPELIETRSMRSLALGGATVAMSGYAGAAPINPASIGLYHVIQGSGYFLSDNTGPMFGKGIGNDPQLARNLYQPYFDYRSDKWAAAFYLSYFYLGRLAAIDEGGRLLKTSRSYHLAVSASGSWEAAPHLRIGIGLRYLTAHLAPLPHRVGAKKLHNPHSVAVDLGLLYQRLIENKYLVLHPSLGWSLTNFGSKLHYTSTDDGDPLPMAMRAGVGLRLSSKKEIYSNPFISMGLYAGLSHLLVRQDKNGHSYGPFKALFKGWSAYNREPYSPQTDVGDRRVGFTDQFFTHAGIEITLLGVFSYRFGYVNRPTAMGYLNEATRGIGVDLYYVALNYAHVSYQDNEIYHYNLQDDESVWQITIRVPLEKPKRGVLPAFFK